MDTIVVAAGPYNSAEDARGEETIRRSFELAELNERQLQMAVETVPQGLCNVQDIYPLSPLQEGMLFHRLLNESSDTYVLSTLFELQSLTHVDALVNALKFVLERHEILRSSVLWKELPRPLQIVHRCVELPVQEIALDPRQDAVEQLVELMRPGRQSWDLQRAPLLQLLLAASAHDARWYAVLHVHHLVADHQSLDLIVAEILSHMQGRIRELPATAPYRDYVANALGHAATPEAEAFFRGKLGDVDEPTAPFGVFDVNGGSQLDELQQMLEPRLVAGIRAQAGCTGVSAARLFHAAWALVVAKTSGREDVVYGTVVLAASQRQERAQRMLGMAVNTLPLRLQLGSLTAIELVQCTHRELSQLLMYEHVPLTVAQRCSGVEAPTPLFTALFNYRHSRAEPLPQNAGAGVRVLARREAWTNYPITLLVDDRGESIALTAQTDQRISPDRVLGYMQTALRSLVEALSTDPKAPAMSLQVLPKSERRKLLEVFNATQVDFPKHKLVHELFEEQVARTPDAVAVVYDDQPLTYLQLNRRANQLARYLIGKGVGPDVLVGLCIERCPEMVIGLLAILKAGGGYVPLDPDYPPQRLHYMIENARPVVVLTQDRFRTELPPSGAELLALDTQWNELADEKDTDIDPRAIGLTSEHLAYVIYTSGSTGVPKGAMNEHRGVVNRLQWMQREYKLDSSDRVLQKTPFSFDVSVWEFFWTLAGGARVVLARPAGHQDPVYLRELIEKAGVTRLHFVPSMLHIFLDQYEPAWCPTIKQIVCSGEELSPTLQNLCFERLPHARLSNLYGPTEAAVDVTAWECMPDECCQRVPIGRPIANIQMYVLDGRLQPAPIGVPGEIHIGGVGVGRGYWNRPELTTERFLQDPFNIDPKARLYKTGDLGRWNAVGVIEYLGRNDHQVKIRGLRIELGEIEAQLVQHAKVREAVVMASQDGGDGQRLIAYVTSSDPEPPIVEELRKHLQSLIPEYMVPSAFMVLERFPLLPNGKLDRRVLPPPDLSAYSTQRFEAPVGEVEELLASMWQQLLQVRKVGRQDDFFDLGGHSMLAMQLVARVRSVMSVEVPIRVVFDCAMLMELSQDIADRRRAMLMKTAANAGVETKERFQTAASLKDGEVQVLMRKQGAGA